MAAGEGAAWPPLCMSSCHLRGIRVKATRHVVTWADPGLQPGQDCNRATHVFKGRFQGACQPPAGYPSRGQSAPLPSHSREHVGAIDIGSEEATRHVWVPRVSEAERKGCVIAQRSDGGGVGGAVLRSYD